MANIQHDKRMLRCIALSVEAANKITGADSHGISSIEEYSQMDKNEILCMFKSMSCPGGFEENGKLECGLEDLCSSSNQLCRHVFFLVHHINQIDHVVPHALVTWL